MLGQDWDVDHLAADRTYPEQQILGKLRKEGILPYIQAVTQDKVLSDWFSGTPYLWLRKRK